MERIHMFMPENHIILITPPVEEPVTIAEVKAFARIDFADEDGLIDVLIKSARRTVEEGLQRRALITQTLKLVLDRFPNCSTILLPRPPLQTVDSIKYYDEDGVLQTFSSLHYQVDSIGEPGRITLQPDVVWPSTQFGKQNAVSITFVAGYGDASAVPENTRVGIMALTTWWLENRDQIGTVPQHIHEQIQGEMFAWVY